MRSFNRLIFIVVILMLAVILAVNLKLSKLSEHSGRPYRVEISRAEKELESGKNIKLEDYSYISGIYEEGEDFYKSDNEYVIRKINGKLYRIEYSTDISGSDNRLFLIVNTGALCLCIIILAVLFYIRQKLIKPFVQMSEVPYKLARGTLSTPVKEDKNRYFGKFRWGLNMLREQLERSRTAELERMKMEKTMLLSLSHDIKTPLSAIKLYSQALAKGLYKETSKRRNAAESINAKADEIEAYVNKIIKNVSENFMRTEVDIKEFYLTDVVERVREYYSDKLNILGGSFKVGEYTNCMLAADPDRLEEVLQNILENAVKYGDGENIFMDFSYEEDCCLITVTNSGCDLPESETAHIFESFWRGSNSKGKSGSGLGLYICRRLMTAMHGDIFAQVKDGKMSVTAVCRKS